MPLFKKKSVSGKKVEKSGAGSQVSLDASTLRQNNITRLTIDERWMKLFVNIPMSPEILKAQEEMNELIKNEAMLRNEQDNLEPGKKRCMNLIMGLTKQAFEDNNDEAKSKLKDCKKEIERINERINKILEDIEKTSDTLRDANAKLLNDTVGYIFTTIKNNKDRSHSIRDELAVLVQKETELKTELDSINLDWTSFAVNFTELIGTDLVKKLESEFGLEELKNETDNSGTDETD